MLNLLIQVTKTYYTNYRMKTGKKTKTKYGIVIVDMQEGGPGLQNKAACDSAVAAQCLVIEAIAPENRSVVFLELLDKGLGQTFSKLEQLIPKLEQLANPATDLVIGKYGSNGFISTDHDGSLYEREGRITLVSLDYHLRCAIDTRELIIGGWHASCCVAETISSGLKRGYLIHTSSDLLMPKPQSWAEYETIFPKTLRSRLCWHESAQQLVEALK